MYHYFALKAVFSPN